MSDRATTLDLPTLANSVPGRGQRLFAGACCAALVGATLLTIPIADQPTGAMPGFLIAHQTALIAVYAISASLFFAHYRRTRSMALLLLGSGALYTTLIMLAQFLSFQNVFGQGRMLGSGPGTTTWLWTFWHVGPPLFALGYALTEGGGRSPTIRPAWVDRAGGLAMALVALGVGLIALLVTQGVDLLPQTIEGDDYRRLATSGVGPGVEALTAVALAVLAWTTRLRTVLQLWLAVSLVLLIGDNLITMLGAVRGSVGWTTGRIEALAAGIVVLGVTLSEIDWLHAHAEATAVDRERERAELQLARDNLAIALDAADMVDWDLDLATDTSRRTLKHDQIFGYDSLQPRWGRRELFAHVWPDDIGILRAAFARGTEKGSFEVQCRIRRAGDGATRWIALRGRVYLDTFGQASRMSGVVMDTTERHETEDRLAQAQKMEAIGQLTGGVAHDFNNLLTIIVGNLDMISRQPDNTRRVERLAESGLIAARRGAEVTQKLLAFSRRQVLRPATVNPNRLLQEFQALLARAVGATVSVALDLDATLDPVRLDPGQFESAILNMAVNARDAMPEGGALALTTRNAVLSAADLTEAPELAPGHYVVVSIADTGTGMDPAIMARVFEPFFTTKDVGRGTGLGLSQVYGFAKQAGGHVTIASRPGQGTTFSLYLPRSAEPTPEHREPQRLPLRRALEGEVILIVEDECAVLDTAVESLRELGYATRVAADAAAALTQLRGPDRIDMLFSDVIMPGGMNGVHLSVEARLLRPDLRVLLTSGGTGATAADGGLPGDLPLLTKPYMREELADKLRVVMGR